MALCTWLFIRKYLLDLDIVLCTQQLFQHNDILIERKLLVYFLNV
jgi:hypothetical protein